MPADPSQGGLWPDPLTLARARAGRAIRELGHAFVGRHASLEQIERLASALEEITSELWPQDRRARDDHPFATLASYGFPQGRFDHGYDDRPVSGRASPLGCDLELHRYGDEIEAHVTFRSAHEGAPGRCHGGIVAALFDDVFGFMLGVIGEPAFTGTLSVRYEDAAPIDVPLACRVRLSDRSGRKLHMTGELRIAATGSVVTTATAVFIAIPAESFDAGGAPATATRPPPPDEGTTGAPPGHTDARARGRSPSPNRDGPDRSDRAGTRRTSGSRQPDGGPPGSRQPDGGPPGRSSPSGGHPTTERPGGGSTGGGDTGGARPDGGSLDGGPSNGGQLGGTAPGGGHPGGEQGDGGSQNGGSQNGGARDGGSQNGGARDGGARDARRTGAGQPFGAGPAGSNGTEPTRSAVRP